MLLIDRVAAAVARQRVGERLAMAIRKIGKRHDSPVVFVSKQRMDAGRTLVGSRAAKPLELSCIAHIRAQDLVVVGLETD
ncbi:electron transfer flavoprotein alpha/beta subunit [Bradyrhizobium sp. CIR18]|uniref:hypothetical protein n=1 Tax=Bradyrhizobium sp. CIR18 TaxID=2663839 RepID=UPI0016062C50|nr:hypothetical protein [Bradyrhizobium sp. CIR18]MBB4365357.1 electron transfer flavoprotein alpha/beta subunit [Bradyrhizobium sp. CIR18]